jgi:gliding motility-associated-like protein
MKTLRITLPVILQLKYRLCLLIILLLASVFGYSQNITKFEYFIDTDPGVGLGTQVNVTPATSITDFNIPVSTSALTPGFHTLYIRSQNELGNWTHTHYRSFFVDNTILPPTISSFNPSSGLVGSTVVITGTNFSTVPANNTVSFNGTPATVTLASATSLTVTVPIGATSGLISVVVGGLTANSGTNFTVSSPNITALEYFFNIDPGPGNGTPISISAGTTIDLSNINIPTTSLPQGWHTLCVRAKDANNVWGFYESRRIYIRENSIIIPPPVVEPITALEFFYNTDNGPGTGTAITITSGTDIDLVNNNLANTLPIGWHTVSVRAKNNANVWGFYESRRIYVREAASLPPPPPSPIVAFEFFVDNDPGVGQSSLNFSQAPTALVDLVDYPLNIGTAAVGAHKIGLRAKNQNGDWSMTEVRDFTVTTPCTILTPPTANNATRCIPGTLTLTASGAAGGQTYRWYADNTTLTALLQGNPFITPSLTVNTNYFVSVYDPTTFCESVRTQVTAIVTGIPKPALNLTGSLAVCAGSSVTLTAPSGYASYTWSNGLTTQSITLTASGVYAVIVGDGTCSSPSSDPFTFTINALPLKPTITATNGGSLCGTGSVTLSAPVGFTSYSWSSGQTTQSITVSSAGNFTVQVTNASGCQSPPADAFSVTTTPPAKPIVGITGNTALCGGSTVTLSAPAGFASYTWSNGSTAQNIIVNTAGSYSVTVANGACISPASDPVAVTLVTILPQPTITVTGNTVLCIGSFAVLTATTAPVYLWSTGETTQQIVVSTAGIYTVQVGNTANCLSVASIATTISLTGIACPGNIPSPAISSGSTCGPGSVALTATGATGGQVYRWYDVPTGGSLLFTGANFSTPTINTTTIYYAAIFDPAVPGEGSRSMGTASVVTFPAPTISPSGTVTVCAGSSTILSAPSGFTNYLWSNGATTQQISVSVAGNYSVQTGNSSCLSAASANVVVSLSPALTKPTVTITGNTVFCGSGSVTLLAPSGFSSYAWSNGATTQSTIVTAIGNYMVAVSNGICTSPSSDAVAVTSVVVPPQPAITITGNTALCNGAFSVLSAPGGFANYLWSTGETTRQIVVTLAGNYTVQVGQAASCLSVASAPTTITLTGSACGGSSTPPSSPVVTSASRCGSGSVTLTATDATVGQVYRWYDAAVLGNLLFTGASFTTPSLTIPTTNYYAKIFDSSSGESSPTIATATIVTIATPTVAGPSSISICTSGNTLLSAPTGFVQYQWSNGATTQQLSVTTAGSYSVQVGDGQCLSSSSNTVVVSVSPALSKPSVTVNGNLVFCGSGSVDLIAPAGFQYVWSTGATTRQITTTTIGNYSVVISNGTCTSPPSDEIIVTSVAQPSKPTITVVGREFVCAGAVVALTAPINFTYYKWSTGETTQTILVDKSGLYTVQVGMSSTCLSLRSDEKEVKIGTPAQCGIVPSASNKAPVITAFSFGVAIQSSAMYSLIDLISDANDNLDITTLRIVDQPNMNGNASGGKASLDSENNLMLDYEGVTFAGKENITLQVCDLDGICAQQTMVIDVVGDVVVFNGITPNGDGVNDFMRLQFIDVLENAKKNNVTIFNRWGETVFEMKDYNNVDRVFIGNSSSGSELPLGTYLYKVILSSGKEYTGFLTLKK